MISHIIAICHGLVVDEDSPREGKWVGYLHHRIICLIHRKCTVATLSPAITPGAYLACLYNCQFTPISHSFYWGATGTSAFSDYLRTLGHGCSPPQGVVYLQKCHECNKSWFPWCDCCKPEITLLLSGTMTLTRPRNVWHCDIGICKHRHGQNAWVNYSVSLFNTITFGVNKSKISDEKETLS
jgi:hypothetical protein